MAAICKQEASDSKVMGIFLCTLLLYFYFVFFFSFLGLTCDGAANFAFAGPNAGTVPFHAILRSLVSLSDSVRARIEFIIARLLGYKWHKWADKPYVSLHLHLT